MGITIEAPGPVTAPDPSNSQVTYASVTSPGSNVTLNNNGAITPGVYQVTVQIELSGTIAAADQDNIKLKADGATIATLLQQALPTTGAPQQPFTGVFKTAGTGFLLASVAAGTTGAIYASVITATRIG